jgi:hypothetical protein
MKVELYFTPEFIKFLEMFEVKVYLDRKEYYVNNQKFTLTAGGSLYVEDSDYWVRKRGINPKVIEVIDKFFKASESTPMRILVSYIDEYIPVLWTSIYKDINPLGVAADDKIEYLKSKFLEHDK